MSTAALIVGIRAVWTVVAAIAVLITLGLLRRAMANRFAVRRQLDPYNRHLSQGQVELMQVLLLTFLAFFGLGLWSLFLPPTAHDGSVPFSLTAAAAFIVVLLLLVWLVWRIDRRQQRLWRLLKAEDEAWYGREDEDG